MDLLIRNARINNDDRLVDIAIECGKISAIGHDLAGEATQVIDACGLLASPPFVDPHFHLENALLLGAGNQSGTLREAIDIYRDIKCSMPKDDILRRADTVLNEAVIHGTLVVRNHVDIDQVAGTKLLEVILAVKQHWQNYVDIQVVAFPQLGLARNPKAVDLLWQAMEMGADVVGGMPHGEQDMDDAARHIEIAFEIARAHDADIDMHVDETDDPYWQTLGLLAESTIANTYQGRVAAGHCCAMSRWLNKVAEDVICKVREARITVCTNAPVNLLLQGREDRQPIARGITRVKELLAAGVNVTCGQDDIMNMFYPYGKMDMLQVALITGHAAHMSSNGEIAALFDMPRYRAAQALRLQGYGLAIGCWGDIVLLDAADALDALRRHPERRWVIRRGKVLIASETRRYRDPDMPQTPGSQDNG